MDQRLNARISTLVSTAWTILMNSLRALITIDTRPYRPEQYYMRGPGPKWREKHAHKGTDAGSFFR